MLTAIIPVKSLNQAKSRLGGVLTPEQRAQLCQVMLHDIVLALRASAVVDLVVVTSPDPTLKALTKRLGVECWPDRAQSLNGAMLDARNAAVRRGSKAVLMLPGDVALVAPGDIRQLAALALEADSAVVAPTHDLGTGAMLLRPPTLIRPQYGGRSALRHLAAARQAGARAILAPLPNLSLDLDEPADLDAFLQMGRSTQTYRFLQGLAHRELPAVEIGAIPTPRSLRTL